MPPKQYSANSAWRKALACAGLLVAMLAPVSALAAHGVWRTDAARQCEGFVPADSRRVVFKGGFCRDGRINGRVTVDVMRAPLGKSRYAGYFVDGINLGQVTGLDGRLLMPAGSDKAYLSLGEATGARLYAVFQPQPLDTPVCQGYVIAATAKTIDAATARTLAQQATQAYYSFCMQQAIQPAQPLRAVTIRLVAEDFPQQLPPRLLATVTTQRTGNSWQVASVVLGANPDAVSSLPASAKAAISPVLVPASLRAAIFMDRMQWNGHPACRVNVRLHNNGDGTLQTIALAATLRDNAGVALFDVTITRLTALPPLGSMTMAKLLPARLCEYVARIDIGTVSCTVDGTTHANCTPALSYVANAGALGAQVADAVPNIRVNF